MPCLKKRKSQRPAQWSNSTQVASDVAAHEPPPEGHHSHQKQKSDQQWASARTLEQPSKIHGHASRATRRRSEFEHTGCEGEGRKTLPASEEFQQVFERFKTDDYSRSNFSEVIQYVHSLQAENNKLAGSYENAKTAFSSFGNTAMSLISKLYPASFKEEMAQKGQFTTSGALNFLLKQYESLWETNNSYCDKINTIDGENKHLRQKLHKQDISHQEQMDQITGGYESRLESEGRRHREERDKITILYDNQLQRSGDKHRHEIDELKLEHQNLTTALKADHKKALADLRVKLEGDICVLQDTVMSFMDRFQPRSDNDLRLQFDGLKGWVRIVARSPLDVGVDELGERLNRTTFVRLAPKIHHKFALESSIWAILMDGIFATPFKIFGDYSSHFSTSWSQLVQENEHPLQPDTFTEKWRCITFEPLRHAVTENMIKRPADEMIRKSYERNVAKIFQSLSVLFSRVSSQDRQAEIRNIVDKACSLALNCGDQRCRLELFAPSLKHKVSRQNLKTYKDMNADNDPSLAEGIVQLVVSPGFRRTGDGHGGSLDEVFDLCPVEVYLTETG